MDQRVEVIREWNDGESVAALADIYGIARKTIYKWIARHDAEGMAGWRDRSRAAHAHPQAVSEETVGRIIEVRQRWGWGPRKLRRKLAEAWPSENDAGRQHHRRTAAP